MGCWDVYCFICGNSASESSNVLNDLDKKIKIKWLKKCIILLTNNDVIFNCENSYGDNEFKDKNGNVYLCEINSKLYKQYKDTYKGCGIFLHSDCYKYVYNNYGIKLKYSDVLFSSAE